MFLATFARVSNKSNQRGLFEKTKRKRRKEKEEEEEEEEREREREREKDPLPLFYNKFHLQLILLHSSLLNLVM